MKCIWKSKVSWESDVQHDGPKRESCENSNSENSPVGDSGGARDSVIAQSRSLILAKRKILGIIR